MLGIFRPIPVCFAQRRPLLKNVIKSTGNVWAQKMKSWTVPLSSRKTVIVYQGPCGHVVYHITEEEGKGTVMTTFFILNLIAGSSELGKEGEKESFARRVTEPVPSTLSVCRQN